MEKVVRLFAQDVEKLWRRRPTVCVSDADAFLSSSISLATQKEDSEIFDREIQFLKKLYIYKHKYVSLSLSLSLSLHTHIWECILSFGVRSVKFVVSRRGAFKSDSAHLSNLFVLCVLLSGWTQRQDLRA